MPIYDIEQDGKIYTIEADTENDAFALLDEELGAENTAGAEQGGGYGKLAALLGGGAALAAGVALKKPGLAKKGLSKAFDVLQGARHLGALSGTAVPKSVVGNVGAPFVAALERKSLEPIKQFFSRQTLQEYGKALRNPEIGRVADEAAGEAPMRIWNPFGRMMSAGDAATRGALGRAGLSAEEAARYTLQSSLPELGVTGKAAEVLSSKPGQYAVMYRRTPINTLVHGGKNIMDRPGMSALFAGTGAAQGAEGGPVSDPLSIALTAPAAGVYTLPYLLGAGVGKYLSSGSKGQAAQVSRGLAPVPEIGPEILEPMRPIDRPAIVSLLERIDKLSRTGRSY